MLKVLSSYYIAFHAASDEQSQNLFFGCSFLFRFVLLFCFVGLGKCGSSHRFPTVKPFDTHLPLVPTKISHNSWRHYLRPAKYTEVFQTLVISWYKRGFKHVLCLLLYTVSLAVTLVGTLVSDIHKSVNLQLYTYSLVHIAAASVLGAV